MQGKTILKSHGNWQKKNTIIKTAHYWQKKKNRERERYIINGTELRAQKKSTHKWIIDF